MTELKPEEEKLPVEEVLPQNESISSGDDTPNTDDEVKTKVTELESQIASLNEKIADFEKTKEERDNYKQGLLNAKEELKKLKGEPKDESFRNPNPVVDETYAEREGKAQFKLKHPNESIKDLLQYYRAKHGSDTATAILLNLEEAMKYRDYEQNNPTPSLNTGNNSQGAGASEPKTGNEKKPLTEKQIEMAKKFGHKPEEVYKD